MKSTDSTNLIETVIASGAASGYVATIPTDQATAGDGTISLTLGSPPECAISVAAGGKRPAMKDVNGVYKLLSAAIQSVQSWGVLPFSSSFATAIGGYPKGAVCSDGSGALWVSSADDNTTVPGATGADWESWATTVMLPFVEVNNSSSITAPTWATQLEFILTGGGGGGSDCWADGSVSSSTNVSGGGGGAGSTVWGNLSVTPGSAVSIVIGAGGGAQEGGGNSSITYNGTTILTAGGGSGTRFAETASSPGGSAGTITGSGTAAWIVGGAGSDGQNGSLCFAGNGGASYWGGGGRAGQGEGGSAGPFGAGGGGAYDSGANNESYSGGSGMSGVLMYRWLP